MSTRKPKPKKDKPVSAAVDRTKDRHKKRSSVNIPPRLHAQLVKLAERNTRPLNWQLRAIIEAALSAEGLWPPAPATDCGA